MSRRKGYMLTGFIFFGSLPAAIAGSIIGANWLFAHMTDRQMRTAALLLACLLFGCLGVVAGKKAHDEESQP